MWAFVSALFQTCHQNSITQLLMIIKKNLEHFENTFNSLHIKFLSTDALNFNRDKPFTDQITKMYKYHVKFNSDVALCQPYNIEMIKCFTGNICNRGHVKHHVI